MASCYRQAVVLTVLISAALAVVVATNRPLAAAIVQENALVEWLQVVLYAAAAVAALRVAHGYPRAPDVLLAAMFAGFIELELDIERLLFGRSVIDRKFLMDGRKPLGLRLLVVVVIATAAIAIAAYAWRHRAELAPAARALVSEPWGHLLLLAVAMLVGVEMTERRLARLLPLPKYFLEESLELLAAIYAFLAMAHRK